MKIFLNTFFLTHLNELTQEQHNCYSIKILRLLHRLSVRLNKDQVVVAFAYRNSNLTPFFLWTSAPLDLAH
jgi:hypothetical protein